MAIDYDEPAHRWRSNAKHFWPNALWPQLGLPVWGCASLRVCVCAVAEAVAQLGYWPAATHCRYRYPPVWWGVGGELAEMRGTLATDNFRCTQIGNWSSSATVVQQCSRLSGPSAGHRLANVINTNIIIFG